MKIKLNPDTEIVNTIKEGLKKTGGYCPCRREKTDDTKCMCKEFKDQIADPQFRRLLPLYALLQGKVISASNTVI